MQVINMEEVGGVSVCSAQCWLRPHPVGMGRGSFLVTLPRAEPERRFPNSLLVERDSTPAGRAVGRYRAPAQSRFGVRRPPHTHTHREARGAFEPAQASADEKMPRRFRGASLKRGWELP